MRLSRSTPRYSFPRATGLAIGLAAVALWVLHPVLHADESFPTHTHLACPMGALHDHVQPTGAPGTVPVFHPFFSEIILPGADLRPLPVFVPPAALPRPPPLFS